MWALNGEISAERSHGMEALLLTNSFRAPLPYESGVSRTTKDDSPYFDPQTPPSKIDIPATPMGGITLKLNLSVLA